MKQEKPPILDIIQRQEELFLKDTSLCKAAPIIKDSIISKTLISTDKCDIYYHWEYKQQIICHSTGECGHTRHMEMDFLKRMLIQKKDSSMYFDLR